uniref:Uncharacterized protein n=1 Tax=Myoviridae sp. ctWPU11 TaxID=2825118 RepID=A0A8S5UAC4_9CAUD|nr:MAG TPA: hypothetical protein [Myoviridae sp. ctWPU11]
MKCVLLSCCKTRFTRPFFEILKIFSATINRK